MTVLYHLSTLTVALGTTPGALAGVEAWCQEAPGTLLGCWTAELGELNRILLLQGFADDAGSERERHRTLHAADPFNCARHITSLSVDRCAPFPGLPAVTPGRFGPVYEVRTYALKPGGLPAVLDAWVPMLPARRAHSPLTVAMHALDGVPRIVHIWPYPDLVERGRKRAEAVAQGFWPPPTAPQIASMQSAIVLPAQFSPLQ